MRTTITNAVSLLGASSCAASLGGIEASVGSYLAPHSGRCSTVARLQ